MLDQLIDKYRLKGVYAYVDKITVYGYGKAGLELKLKGLYTKNKYVGAVAVKTVGNNHLLATNWSQPIQTSKFRSFSKSESFKSLPARHVAKVFFLFRFHRNHYISYLSFRFTGQCQRRLTRSNCQAID